MYPLPPALGVRQSLQKLRRAKFKKLQRDELIDYLPYKGARLTKKGREIGANITRRHRLWELYLHDVLGFSWSEVHEEAERLEHASSDALIDRIEEHLDFPISDPHGSPIPSKTGDIPKKAILKPLSDLDSGSEAVVTRVQGLGAEFLNYLQSIGLGLQDKIKVLEKRAFDDSIVVSIKGEKQVLTGKSAQAIFIESVKVTSRTRDKKVKRSKR